MGCYLFKVGLRWQYVGNELILTNNKVEIAKRKTDLQMLTVHKNCSTSVFFIYDSLSF